jgi:uncharacterized membrane protein
MDFQDAAEAAGKAVDTVGTVIILVGGVAAIVLAVRGLVQRRPSVYGDFRRFFGRSILLGLEFLVAADIIRTVAVTPTLESVGVLGLIVIIRTALSFSLELEITGRWPWQKEPVTSS